MISSEIITRKIFWRNDKRETKLFTQYKAVFRPRSIVTCTGFDKELHLRWHKSIPMLVKIITPSDMESLEKVIS